MWELDYKESWVLKNWCFWTVVLKKTLESLLDCREIKPVNPKGTHSWIFIGRTDAEAETLILCAPGVKNWLPGKDSDTEKDWRQKEKGTTEDEIIGWHHRLNGPEFEQAPRVGDGQGSLVCYSPWGCKVRHYWVTELNWCQFDYQCFGELHILFHNGYMSLHSHQQCSRVPFPPHSFNIYFFVVFFDNSHFDRCEAVSHYGFDLHFPDN